MYHIFIVDQVMSETLGYYMDKNKDGCYILRPLRVLIFYSIINEARIEYDC